MNLDLFHEIPRTFGLSSSLATAGELDSMRGDSDVPESGENPCFFAAISTW